jgi:predicted NAD/FAD-binding protein
VIAGGAQRYVAALSAGFRDRIRLRCPVERVQRWDNRIELTLPGGFRDVFDHVVFACHSDQALKLLGDEASLLERDVLSAFPYQRNVAVLHTDVSLLPARRRAWASWNYRVNQSDAATVTYNMNILQGIESRNTFCVTLNDTEAIDPSKVLRTIEYAHPMFTMQRAAAQSRHGELIDVNRTSYCGAYWKNGFHEDGVVSALAVVDVLRKVPRKTSMLTATIN